MRLHEQRQIYLFIHVNPILNRRLQSWLFTVQNEAPLPLFKAAGVFLFPERGESNLCENARRLT